MNEQRLKNAERESELDLQPDFIRDLRREISHSRLRYRGANRRFTNALSNELDYLEYRKEINAHRNPMLPEMDKADSATIGYTVSGNNDYQIRFKKFVLHMLITGCSGSGKSTLINLIISQIVGKCGITFFDHKDEGLRFANKYPDSIYAPISKQRWNLLASQGDQKAYSRYVSRLLADTMRLVIVTANAQQALLPRLCSNLNDLPSLSDLAVVFRKMAQREGRSILNTASRTLEDLQETLGDWARVRQGEWPFSGSGMEIIPLRSIPAAIENLYIHLFYTQLTDYITQSGHDTDFSKALIFDEGRNFFGVEFAAGKASGRANVQTQITTQARSYGIALIVATQSGSMLQPSVVDNSSTFIALRTNSVDEAKFCCRRLGIPEKQYRKFLDLPVGQAWVKSPTCPQPVHIRIPNHDLGEYPSTEEVETRMAPIWGEWDRKAVLSNTETEKNSALDFHEILGERPLTESQEPEAPSNSVEEKPTSSPIPKILGDEIALLSSCADNPEFGATDHYRALGWSAGKGNRIKQQLIESNWITSTRKPSPTGGRPRVSLAITQQAERILNEYQQRS